MRILLDSSAWATVFRPAPTGMAFSLTIAPLTDNAFWVSSYSPIHLFKKRVLIILTDIFAFSGTLSILLPSSCLHFLDELNCWYVYTVIASSHSPTLLITYLLSLFTVKLKQTFFRHVRKLRKAIFSFVMYASHSACLSTWNNSTPTGQIVMKFGIEYCLKICQVSLKYDKSNWYFAWRPLYIYDHTLLNSSYNERCFRLKL